MKHILLALVLCMSLTAPAVADSGDVKLDITVNGLVCDFCARAVEKVFSQEFELKDIDIDLSKKLISVVLPAGAEVSDEKVKKLIEDSGYAFVGLKRHEAGN
jgi:copper chaperone CopZ